jgi:hypothetical protein
LQGYLLVRSSLRVYYYCTKLKLKKWEQDLELKDKLLNENSKDCTKLVSYVTKLENQNQELNMHKTFEKKN